MEVKNALQKILHGFLEEYCDYLPPGIPKLTEIPTPMEFLNEYVLTNIPFIVKCPEDERVPAVELWQDENYLRKLMFEKNVSVNVTPDGHADSIRDGLFMIPEERGMTFDKFYTEHKMRDMHQVYYLQKQDNNLHTEFYPLLRDVEGGHCPWATEAFGKLPDASNIWIGDHRSVTSLHRDHYENIYYVIKGKKTFLLYPPIAIGWLPYKKCKKFQWQWEGSPGDPKWTMKDMNEEVEWILSDPKPDSPEQFVMYQNTKAYYFDVNPGEILYLPALWFHQVTQSDGCIAVNYWYDMKYDCKYPFMQLFKNLCNYRRTPRKTVAVDKPAELSLSLITDIYNKKKPRREIYNPKKWRARPPPGIISRAKTRALSAKVEQEVQNLEQQIQILAPQLQKKKRAQKVAKLQTPKLKPPYWQIKTEEEKEEELERQKQLRKPQYAKDRERIMQVQLEHLRKQDKARKLKEIEQNLEEHKQKLVEQVQLDQQFQEMEPQVQELEQQVYKLKMTAGAQIVVGEIEKRMEFEQSRIKYFEKKGMQTLEPPPPETEERFVQTLTPKKLQETEQGTQTRNPKFITYIPVDKRNPMVLKHIKEMRIAEEGIQKPQVLKREEEAKTREQGIQIWEEGVDIQKQIVQKRKQQVLKPKQVETQEQEVMVREIDFQTIDQEAQIQEQEVQMQEQEEQMQEQELIMRNREVEIQQEEVYRQLLELQSQRKEVPLALTEIEKEGILSTEGIVRIHQQEKRLQEQVVRMKEQVVRLRDQEVRLQGQEIRMQEEIVVQFRNQVRMREFRMHEILEKQEVQLPAIARLHENVRLQNQEWLLEEQNVLMQKQEVHKQEQDMHKQNLEKHDQDLGVQKREQLEQIRGQRERKEEFTRQWIAEAFARERRREEENQMEYERMLQELRRLDAEKMEAHQRRMAAEVEESKEEVRRLVQKLRLKEQKRLLQEQEVQKQEQEAQKQEQKVEKQEQEVQKKEQKVQKKERKVQKQERKIFKIKRK